MYFSNFLARICRILFFVLIVALILGLSPTKGFADDTGFKSPSLSIPAGQFSNPDNAFASNNSYATTSTNNHSQQYADFGLSIPAGSTISGIEVTVEGKTSSTAGGRKFIVSLSGDGGITFTTEKDTDPLVTMDTTSTLGGIGDLWSTSWSESSFTTANFRVKVTSFITGAAVKTLSLDHVQVKVYYTAATDTAAPSLAFTAPASNAVVGGTNVPVALTATDATPPITVALTVPCGTSTPTSGEIGSGGTANFTWNTTAASACVDGNQTLSATATDSATPANTSSPVTRDVTVDNTPPAVTIDAIMKTPVPLPPDSPESAIVCAGGNLMNDPTCTGTMFIRQTVQIQGTVTDAHLVPGSIALVVEKNAAGAGILEIDLAELVSCSSATSCTFTADFNTINDTNDGPNEIIVTASDLSGNEGSVRKLVMVDNTPPVISSLTMDKSEYIVGDTILVNASNVNDNLPADVLDTLNTTAPAPSGIAGVGANVTTTVGVQPAVGIGDFLGNYNALTQDGSDPAVFSSPADFLADATGEITATALAIDNVGNLSDSQTASATGYNSTNLICEPAYVTSGRTATLFLGTLINTTPNPGEPVPNQPVLVEIFDTNNVLVFSDQVSTDGEGKVNVTNTFNLPSGTYKLMLTYAGTGPTAPFLSSSSCYSEPGFLVRSLANGGGFVFVGTNAKNGQPYKGTFGFNLEANSGFVANDTDGFLNDPASPVKYTGEMNFINHETKGHYQVETIDTLSWEGSTGIKFGGTGRYRHPELRWSSVNYDLTVHDNGEPGNARAITASGALHPPDSFELYVTPGDWTTPDPTLQGGNIKVRQ